MFKDSNVINDFETENHFKDITQIKKESNKLYTGKEEKKLKAVYKLFSNFKKIIPIIKNKLLNSKRKHGFMRYFEYKFFKQKMRYKKIVRIKPVHFYIANFLHVDFRTLRSIKTDYPEINEIYYPFRGSIAKISNFYHSRGF